MNKKLLAATLAVSLFLVFGAPAFAQSRKPSPLPSPRAVLNQVKLRACQAKEETIQTRAMNLVRFAENMERAFDSIVARVEKFYTDKVLPTGKTVSNYDALVSDISAKKDIVTTDLTNAQTHAGAFNCEGDDPKGLLTQFRLDMQKVKTDLKNYRISVKNLIVAVRGVAPKESPKPSKSPKATPVPTP